MNNQSLAQKQRNTDGDQIALSVKNQDKEDWDGKHQDQKTSSQPQVQRPQTRCPLSLQKPEAPIDKYPSQTKTHQQWEAEMERLNTKYKLDSFSDSELDSESDEREQ